MVNYTVLNIAKHDSNSNLLTDGTLLFQQVPLLQWNGDNMVQSFAIVRHIARKYDLYGSKEDEFR